MIDSDRHTPWVCWCWCIVSEWSWAFHLEVESWKCNLFGATAAFHHWRMIFFSSSLEIVFLHVCLESEWASERAIDSKWGAKLYEWKKEKIKWKILWCRWWNHIIYFLLRKHIQMARNKRMCACVYKNCTFSCRGKRDTNAEKAHKPVCWCCILSVVLSVCEFANVVVLRAGDRRFAGLRVFFSKRKAKNKCISRCLPCKCAARLSHIRLRISWNDRSHLLNICMRKAWHARHFTFRCAMCIRKRREKWHFVQQMCIYDEHGNRPTNAPNKLPKPVLTHTQTQAHTYTHTRQVMAWPKTYRQVEIGFGFWLCTHTQMWPFTQSLCLSRSIPPRSCIHATSARAHLYACLLLCGCVMVCMHTPLFVCRNTLASMCVSRWVTEWVSVCGCMSVHIIHIHSNRFVRVRWTVVLSCISSSSNRFEKESG